MNAWRHLLALSALSLVLSLPIPAGGIPVNPYEVVPLADGVYAVVWRDPLANPVESNCLIIVNEEDVVVVDACFFPSTARRVAAEIRKLTPNPVRYVVNTHWHDDHHNGNQVYRELWPGVEFIAHRDARADMADHTYATRREDLENTRKEGARYDAWFTSGLDDDGKPLAESRRARAGELGSLLRASADEMETLRDTPPGLVFADSLTMHRGERTIEVRWLGRGNTRGDAVVFLPKERIAATGDLLVAPIPFGIGSYYRDWIATLGRVDALAADILVPGHGAIQRERSYLHQVEGLLGALVAQVGRAVADSASLEQAQERITLGEWKTKFAGADEALGRSFDAFFVRPAVGRAWRQEKGEPDAVQGIE
jgi:glyoxylase-like metal-dependent hydrolase (beta-lactamase superfamily II)